MTAHHELPGQYLRPLTWEVTLGHPAARFTQSPSTHRATSGGRRKEDQTRPPVRLPFLEQGAFVPK